VVLFVAKIQNSKWPRHRSSIVPNERQFDILRSSLKEDPTFAPFINAGASMALPHRLALGMQ
jgi:hypothetical protein